MNLRGRWVAILVLISGTFCVGQDLPRDVFAHMPEDEVIDLLFFGEKRPLLVRVRLRVNGQGYRLRSFDLAAKLHRDGDRNQDGVLDLVESKAVVDGLLDLALPIGTTPSRSVSTTIYPGSDMKVGDLARFLEQQRGEFTVEPISGFDPNQVEPSFTRLDLDHDGALSGAEVAGVANTLASYDLDDDEVVTADELAPYRSPFANRVLVTGRPQRGQQSSSTLSVLDRSAWNTANRIYHRYSLSLKQDFLGADRLDIDRAAFERIDADHDGRTTMSELAQVVQQGPDLELIVRVGRREPGDPAIEVIEPSNLAPFGRPMISKSASGSLSIPLGNDLIAIEVEPERTLPAVSVVNRSRFRAADLDGNNVLDPTELAREPRLKAIALQADRDRDQRLSESEFLDYFVLRTEVAALRCLITAAARLRTMMDIFDSDRDQKIGVREIRQAPGRLAGEDSDGDGRITSGELIRNQQWVFQQGRPNNNIDGVNNAMVFRTNTPNVAPRPRNTSGEPPWFSKMDRNQDGDISLAEFLGRRSTFLAYDTNGDGLIDPSEAVKAGPKP